MHIIYIMYIVYYIYYYFFFQLKHANTQSNACNTGIILVLLSEYSTHNSPLLHNIHAMICTHWHIAHRPGGTDAHTRKAKMFKTIIYIINCQSYFGRIE